MQTWRVSSGSPSGLEYSYRAVLSLLDKAAIECEQGFASRGGAQMQRSGKVHASFRAVKGCGKQARVLDRNARQPREGPECRRDLFGSKAVDAPQDPFAFQQNRRARNHRPAVYRGPALADWSGSSPVRYRTTTLVSIARMPAFRFRHDARLHLRQGPGGAVAGEPAKHFVRPGLREP